MTDKAIATAPPFNPYLALIVGTMAVSTGAIFARLADAPALVIAAYRVGLATLILAPIAWVKARDEIKTLSKRDLKLAVISGFFLALHFATWISSLDYTSVANSVVLVNTNPLWVGLLTPLIAKERVKRAAVYSICISVIGGAIIGYGDFATGGKALLGDGLALAGSICAAIYLLLGRSLRRKLSLVAYIFICYGSAAVILWIIVLSLRLPITGFSPGTVAAFWGMALIAQIIGHSTYNWALRWLTAGLIAVSLLGEPIGSTILAYLIFDEGLTVYKAVGGVIILSAIYLAASAEHRNSKLK
ncbi:MAG: DMT family transporter [Deltaproteobacteria bacterium]|jgi:drug/metabolite transporter (DMT)-like permease|nr:DMT family transporter [Deltaproteobacteria bacterium]MBW2470190.1 DMT family transporter [Deltaproteobacteria bacterium]MBW2487486.1 DMT family transporter [Deltaproteobacteria bacterium]MBW2515851.1 DMT family transporter [Deltaproteobacteria bacterium]